MVVDTFWNLTKIESSLEKGESSFVHLIGLTKEEASKLEDRTKRCHPNLTFEEGMRYDPSVVQGEYSKLNETYELIFRRKD